MRAGLLLPLHGFPLKNSFGSLSQASCSKVQSLSSYTRHRRSSNLNSFLVILSSALVLRIVDSAPRCLS